MRWLWEMFQILRILIPDIYFLFVFDGEVHDCLPMKGVQILKMKQNVNANHNTGSWTAHADNDHAVCTKR